MRFEDLTKSQKEAVTRMLDWLESPDSGLYFCLIGFAGTGKSTCIKFVLEHHSKVIVTAPTHKARTVIQNFTGKSSATIQKIIGLAPSGVDNALKIDFKLSKKSMLGDFDLLVIDECSMIPNDILKFIVDTNINTKIIFMGDKYQLFPVNQITISKTFNCNNYYELTEIIRYNDIHIGKLVDNARLDVIKQSNTLQYKLKDYESDNVVIHKDPVKFLKSFKTKYISYHNKSANKVNKHLLNTFFPTSNIPIQEGMLLIGNVTNSYLENSAEYTVLFVKKIKYGYDVKLIDNYGNNILVFIIDTDDKDAVNYYITNLMNKKTKANYTKKWQPYFEFKENNLLLSPLSHHGIEIPADINYGYAITVHKSQGSTYSETHINLKDIYSCENKIDISRLVYVALSRASKKINIFI